MSDNNNGMVLANGETMTFAGLEVRTRENVRGQFLGTVISLCGDRPLSEVRAEGKAKGLKGGALRRYVEAPMHGDALSAAWARKGLIEEKLRASGVCPTEFKQNKAGDGFTLGFVLPKADAGKAKADAEAVKTLADENAKLRAQLAALLEGK